MKKLFTSESVTEGHPDKICDQISDAVLDEVLRQDKDGRVACETCVKDNLVMVFGEISTSANIDIQKIARDTIRDIGYTDPKLGFDADSCSIINMVGKQSGDIAMGVDHNKKDDDMYYEIGAGDQGLMFGYACNETPTYMPAPIHYAHRLAKRLSDVRKDGTLPYLRPDGKTQVTFEYDENGKPFMVDTIVISTQHSEDVELETLKHDIAERVIKYEVPKELLVGTRILINPTGRFVTGGPKGDAGLTGRKIIVDTYGGYGRHGGGCFSGKDPSKVDRSAAYMARWIAKNVVNSALADKCEIQLAYAIGVVEPVSVAVNTFGTGKYPDEEIAEYIIENFALTPSGIINRFDLLRPIYRKTAAYGHFGRSEFPWEELSGDFLK